MKAKHSITMNRNASTTQFNTLPTLHRPLTFLGLSRTNSLGGVSTSKNRSADTQQRSPERQSSFTSSAASQYWLMRLATHTPGHTRRPGFAREKGASWIGRKKGETGIARVWTDKVVIASKLAGEADVRKREINTVCKRTDDTDITNKIAEETVVAGKE